MMRLGDYSFEWNPDKMTIPERYRPISEVETYQGSAIFLWDILLQGIPVTLEWKYLSIDQYNKMRAKYLAGVEVEFNPDTGGTSYNVMVLSLIGQYIDVVHSDSIYRQNTKMILSIRSAASTTTTTTTTTSSSTTSTVPI
jgi:hypothetical protein